MPLTVRDLFRPPPRLGVDNVAGDDTDAAVLRDRSDRLWLPFNVVFGILTLVGTGAALIDTDASAASRFGGPPLVALGVVGYLILVRPFTTGVHPGSPRAIGWVALAAGVLVALLFVHPGYWFASPVVFFQLWMFLPVGYAAITAAGLSFILWIQPDLAAGNGFIVTPVGLTIFGVSVVVSTMLGLLITAIARQSSDRLSLVQELRAERAARVDAEREAGALAERTRLSRDLHDTLAQNLTSIVMRLETAAAAMPDGAAGRTQVDDATRIARGGLDEVRRLLWALRPSELGDASVVGALDRLATTWSADHGVSASVRWDGDAVPLLPAVDVTLLRLTQEALSNVARHAGATMVDIVVTVFDDVLHLDVRDDGRGFNPARLAVGEGDDGRRLGLIGMRERVAALGGTLEIESERGTGTTIAVTIPCRFERPAVQGQIEMDRCAVTPDRTADHDSAFAHRGEGQET